MNRRSLTRLAGALFIATVLADRAAAECIELNPAGVEPPVTITDPGSYCLVRDMLFGASSGVAITINASDVRLDLKGYHIKGFDFGVKTAVTAQDRSNLTIRNGSISGFRYAGVNLTSTTSPGVAVANVVEDLHLFNNGGTGIAVSGRGTVVRRNLLVETGKSFVDSYAIGVLGNGHRIVENEIVTMRKLGTTGLSRGIWVNGGREVLVLDNRITASDYGILYDASTGVVRDNLVFAAPSPYVILNGFGYSNAGNNF